jgi:pimeloyl-ACP methyl ester carboxylesterase
MPRRILPLPPTAPFGAAVLVAFTFLPLRANESTAGAVDSLKSARPGKGESLTAALPTVTIHNNSIYVASSGDRFMSRQAARFLVVLAGTLISALGSAAFGQEAKPEEIRFDSADKVELKGSFWPGKANKGTVIFLHRWGGNRHEEGWESLANELQKRGYAILSFDFRGHNESTKVDNGFWAAPTNKAVRMNREARDKISYKDFPRNYLPVLLNDIAAAKRYLDIRNDQGDCNSSNTIVIGAEEGAALAAAWICLEWQRDILIPNPNAALFPLAPKFISDPNLNNREYHGKDIKAAVFLSMPERLEGYTVKSLITLKSPIVMKKVPMAFVHGSKDAKSAKLNEDLSKTIIDRLKRDALDAKQVGVLATPDSAALGHRLLGKEDRWTEDKIANFLDNMLEKKGVAPIEKRDVKNGPPFDLVNLKLLGL